MWGGRGTVGTRITEGMKVRKLHKGTLDSLAKYQSLHVQSKIPYGSARIPTGERTNTGDL